jgi:Zn finger protein HypA/HybF involved in hydrogenase expression
MRNPRGQCEECGTTQLPQNHFLCTKCKTLRRKIRKERYRKSHMELCRQWALKSYYKRKGERLNDHP